MNPIRPAVSLSPLSRIRLWYAGLLLIMAVFVVRLFYLQIIRHDYYQNAALTNQLKQYEIPAERGIMLVHNGDEATPIVLNEVRYTVYADPKFIENPAETALAVAKILDGNATEYEEKMKADNRYQVLAKQVSRDKQEEVIALKLKGVGAQPANYRTYPQGDLAAQILGFVNDEGQGTYGLEQSLNDHLDGKPGQLKAITDVSGVPLAANRENLIVNPEPGKDVLLTIDLGMQSQLEDILEQGVKNKSAKSGSALIIEAETGSIKAMANYPSYNPSEYSKVSDASLFTNASVSAQLEVGSIMKPLTAAAALDKGVVNTNSSYYDPSRFTIDGHVVSNIEEDGGPGTKNLSDILQLSLNTGATWLLMQMGGGEINEQARLTWHDYMVNHYQLGKKTNVEQGYEAEGFIPDPNDGFGLNIRFANTSFGQGMSATPLQMGAAIASVLNGGTYYQPRLVEAYINDDNEQEQVKPIVVRQNVVSATVGQQITGLMEYVIDKNYLSYGVTKPNPAFRIGGKTGTAQIARPEGGYYDDRFNGLFMGFVGGNKAQYVIVVMIEEPKFVKYAGSGAAAPVFGRLADMLVNQFGVTPKQ